MPRYKGRIRRQHSFQTGDTTTSLAQPTTSGSDADLESLISMDTFTDARSSPSLNGHQVRESADRQTTSSTHPLIDHRINMTTHSNQQPQHGQNRRDEKTWTDYLPGFLKRRRRQINNAPTIIYTDGNGSASVRSNIKIDENGVPSAVKMRRISPAKSRSRSIEPKGCYFSDGARLIDYVLVYDLDPHEESDKSSVYEEKIEVDTFGNNGNAVAARQHASDKRRIFETNLQKMGLELEYTFAKHSRTGFVLIHAPFKVLMKQAELLKIKMPVNQNDVRKHANMMDGAVNEFLKRFRFLDFSDKVKERIEPADYFTQPFIEQHLDCFINNENPAEFFSKSQRSRMVYDILIRTRYDTLEETSDKLRFGVERLIRNNAYNAYYPIHEELDYDSNYDPETCSTRKLLFENWVRPRNFCKYQPLHTIKDYFGTKIGFYFAWLGYYTRFLYAVSFLGLLTFMFGVFTMGTDVPSNQICDKNNTKGGAMIVCPVCDIFCDYTFLSSSCFYSKIAYVFDNYGTVIFASLVSIWATLFLEGWKRYHAELAYKWNVFDFEADDEVLRPEFQFRRRKHLRLNPVTQDDEPYVPLMEKAMRFAFSGVSVLFFISLILALVIGVVFYRVVMITVVYHYYDEGITNFKLKAAVITSTSAALINLAFILMMNQVYNRLAMKLTEMECPRTQSEFDNSYTFKVFMFQFINFYSSLAYIAFAKGRVGTVPEDHQLFFGYRLEQCDPSGCMVELVIQLFIIMSGKQVFGAFMETVYPMVLNWLRRARLNLPETDKQRLNRLRQESNAVFEAQPEGVSLVEKDYALNPVSEQFLFDEYLEMVIQFGFCTLFVSAFPLAPFFALLNNVLEIRLDAYKFIVTQRKPMPLPARSIGIWFTILDLISNLSVLCNAFVIGFTSDFVPKLLHTLLNGSLEDYVNDSMAYYDARNITILASDPMYNNTPICRIKDYRRTPCSLINDGFLTKFSEDSCDNLYSHNNHWWKLLAFRLIFVIVFEHVVLAIKAIFSYIIPDIPTKIVVQLQRERYLARQAVLRGSDDHSSGAAQSAKYAETSEDATDTDAVAYQTGKEALDGQDLEPSSALKRMYSNRKRPSLSPHASSTNLNTSTTNLNAPPTNSLHHDQPQTPTGRPTAMSLQPERFGFSSDSDSFRTAVDESPVQRSKSLYKVV